MTCRPCKKGGEYARQARAVADERLRETLSRWAKEWHRKCDGTGCTCQHKQAADD